MDQDDSFENSELIATDLEASNGIAHAIDAILLLVDLGADDDAEEEPTVVDDDYEGGLESLLLGLGLIGVLALAGMGMGM